MFKPENKEWDIFISYRHETSFYMAQVLYLDLISRGYSVFMDKTMDSGVYRDKIHTAILNSKNFIVVLFPDDVPTFKSEKSWLNIEVSWALENPDITIIPLMCDKFRWPRDDEDLSEEMKKVKENNGVKIHKDNSFDNDLDLLCHSFLKNVSHLPPSNTTSDFFRFNLEEKPGIAVTGVDMAFHAGAPWLHPGEKKGMLVEAMEKKIPWRILINTVDAAESIGQHMRDKTAIYTKFNEAHEKWKAMAELYPDTLEVRECPIPLIHIHHAIRFINTASNVPFGEQHIKYYAYGNTRLDRAYEHIISSNSNYYPIYENEFEFLWKQSKKL